RPLLVAVALLGCAEPAPPPAPTPTPEVATAQASATASQAPPVASASAPAASASASASAVASPALGCEPTGAVTVPALFAKLFEKGRRTVYETRDEVDPHSPTGGNIVTKMKAECVVRTLRRF